MFNLKIVEITPTTLESLDNQIHILKSDLDANISDEFRSMINLRLLNDLKNKKENLEGGSANPCNQKSKR